MSKGHEDVATVERPSAESARRGPAAGRAYRFAFVATYMGVVDYRVTGDGEPYEVSLRREAGDYERKNFNGTAEEWERDVVGAIGLLRRAYHSEMPIPDAVVTAFNAWRDDEWRTTRAKLLGSPERYGKPDGTRFWEDLLRRPEHASGAVYEVRWNRPGAVDRWRHGHVPLGWRVTTPAGTTAPAVTSTSG